MTPQLFDVFYRYLTQTDHNRHWHGQDSQNGAAVHVHVPSHTHHGMAEQATTCSTITYRLLCRSQTPLFRCRHVTSYLYRWVACSVMLQCTEDGTICMSPVFGFQRSHAAGRSNLHDLKGDRPGRGASKHTGHAHQASCLPINCTSAAAGWLTLVCGSRCAIAAASMRSGSEDHEVSQSANRRQHRWAAPGAPHALSRARRVAAGPPERPSRGAAAKRTRLGRNQRGRDLGL